MNLTEFTAAVDAASPPDSQPLEWPPEWPELLKSLAFDRAGDWETAHSIAQDDPSDRGSAVHAFLHREEGVDWNADYWYRRAGRPRFSGSLEKEWKALAMEFLG
ncbi:MAG: hypothetical protein RQ801_11295 [Spirochaetaceae bacterium]|nr:hypothetical protein [Spirochaetaceae bacterium]MDT8298879.1 hypothetical protein [Spirochaetaceae bacterium]